MTTKPLTRRQTEVLQFIKSFITKNTYPPTVREIAEHLDLKSHSTAFCLLEQLVRKGFIKKGAGSRELQVIDGDGSDSEIARLRAALVEAKGDLEFILSWDGLPETVVTWVNTAISSVNEEIKEGKNYE